MIGTILSLLSKNAVTFIVICFTVVIVGAGIFAGGAYWQYTKDELRIAQAEVKIKIDTVKILVKIPPVEAQNVPVKKDTTRPVDIRIDSTFTAMLRKGIDSLQSEYDRVCEAAVIDTVLNGVVIRLDYLPYDRMYSNISITIPPQEQLIVTVEKERLVEQEIPWWKVGAYVAAGSLITAVLFLALGN